MSGQAHPGPSFLEQGVLTAAQTLDWRCRQAKAHMPALPRAAILTHQSSLLGRRWPWQRERSLSCLSFDVRMLSGDVALAGCRGVGAPATAVAIEEMAVAGVKQLLAIDLAGSLEPRIHSGDIVVVDAASTGDGTSRHYTDQPLVRPADSLVGMVEQHLSTKAIPHTRGIVWSTDAVYRETPSMIAEARAIDAVAVDMETASLLAVSTTLGIEAAAVLVVADELFDGWRPPADMSRVQARLRQLLVELAACLQP